MVGAPSGALFLLAQKKPSKRIERLNIDRMPCRDVARYVSTRLFTATSHTISFQPDYKSGINIFHISK